MEEGTPKMRYVVDIDLSEGDCSFCPYFQRYRNEEADCNLAKRELEGVLRDSGKRAVDKLMCFDRPEWCPLHAFTDVMDKKPSKNEASQIVHIELYQSEIEKLDAIAFVNKLNRAQMIAKLIGDYMTAKPYVNHGDHGPEPLFEGDAWTMWHCCGNCDHPISYGDNFCRTCGASIEWPIPKGADR